MSTASGELRLISAGTGNNSSRFENANVDGSSVFFTTYDALAPQDKEPGIGKLYVAREGGGFPYTPPKPPCDVSAGACEGSGTAAPEQPGAGSAVFSGPGNPKANPKKRCPKGKRKVKRKGKVHCVKRRHHKRHHRRHHKKGHHKKGKRGANNNRRAGR